MTFHLFIYSGENEVFSAALGRNEFCYRGDVAVTVCSPSGDYPAPRAVLTGHDHEVVCVSVCAELGLVISGAKG